MKYAVIGTGKTGQAVLDLLPAEDVIAVCNSRNPATLEKLKGADVGVVFVPGPAMDGLMPLLFESQIPWIIGTTGYPWPQDLDAKLKAAGVAWVLGQNYSFGLNVMRYFSERIQKTLEAVKPGVARLGMVEKHHIHKLDAPSGTGIYIANALSFPPEKIESIREGDAKGTHTVTFDLPYDRVSITHEASDRKAFGEGVVLACGQAPALAPGLHHFEKLTDILIETKLRG